MFSTLKQMQVKEIKKKVEYMTLTELTIWALDKFPSFPANSAELSNSEAVQIIKVLKKGVI